MEKRRSPKNRSAVKQSGERKPQSGDLASGKRYPSKTQLGDRNPIEKRGGISFRRIDLKNVDVDKILRKRVLRAPDNAVNQVIDRATEVIGNREEAMRWLGTPVRGLDFATPISLLATEEGTERVNDILGQMEHGVW